MHAIVLWLTHDEARIIHLKPEGHEVEHMHQHGGKHHAESLGRNHTQQQGDAEHFFHEVALKLSKTPSERWLVMGPGLAKSHFKNHIERHHKNELKKIVGVEAMDKATDGEIANAAHNFFKNYNLFNG
jgi:stalled ribosome rescue protein Dom34